MTLDDSILSKAIAWAEAMAADIGCRGVPLSVGSATMARRVGVFHPDRVRILEVDTIPVPEEPNLRALAVQTGLLGPRSIGLTVGHGIFIHKDHKSSRLVTHELRHVHQYETAGSIAAFLPVYLQQILDYGYAHAPLEMDARAHEQVGASDIPAG
jgi:hypothetical protein